jgi:hypothetical protein
MAPDMQNAPSLSQPNTDCFVIVANADTIDAEVLAAFDKAIQPFEPAAELLSVNATQGLSGAMLAFVDALLKLNIDRISRKFNWYERFTGIDLEVRIEFDIAAHGLSAQMVELGVAAGRARQVLAMMQSELPRLKEIQTRHEGLLDAAAELLNRQDFVNPDVERFQRRLANLEALAASDRMTEAHVRFAIQSLTSLLDRHSEIEKTLFPIWQQHALAIAQSNDRRGAGSVMLDKFKNTHQQLAARLVE